MIDLSEFLAEDVGAVDCNRLLVVASALLISGIIAHELFGSDVVEHVTAEDPGVEAFGARLGFLGDDATTR